MPIKWTAEVDQVLLLKILETSNINADVKAISEAWPIEMEKPTPRAITERLVKIRASAKNAGTSTHFSVSGKPSTGAGTPRKRAGAGSANATKKTTTPKKNGTKASSQAKRKRGGNVSEDDESGGDRFKSEGNDTNASDSYESPSKKTKTGRKAIVKLEDGDEDNEEVINGEEDSMFA